MKASQLAFVIAIVGGLFGLSPEATAGGAGDPTATCVVSSPAGQSLTGAAAVTYHNQTGSTTFEFAEVTVALQREAAGTPEFFRGVVRPIFVLSPQGVTCQILNAMGNAILIRFYGSAAGRVLKIGEDAVTETDGHAPLVPGDPNAQSALVNVRIFVQSE